MLLEAHTLISPMIPVHAVEKLLLHIHNHLRQVEPDAEEDKDGPLPPEGVEADAEDEPPDQLEVCEEVEGAGGAAHLEEARHVDPAAHPEGRGTGERVAEEHEQNARVDADVPVAHGADGGDVGAVDG